MVSCATVISIKEEAGEGSPSGETSRVIFNCRLGTFYASRYFLLLYILLKSKIFSGDTSAFIPTTNAKTSQSSNWNIYVHLKVYKNIQFWQKIYLHYIFSFVFFLFFIFQGQNVYFNVEKWLNDTIKVIETTDKKLDFKNI